MTESPALMRSLFLALLVLAVHPFQIARHARGAPAKVGRRWGGSSVLLSRPPLPGPGSPEEEEEKEKESGKASGPARVLLGGLGKLLPFQGTQEQGPNGLNATGLQLPGFGGRGVSSYFGGLVAGCVLTVGVALVDPADLAGEKVADDGGIKESVVLFRDVLETLNDEYVDEVDPRALFATAVDAMARSLDPYTEFEATKKAAQDMREAVSGRYGGVGLVIAAPETQISRVKKSAASKAKPAPGAVTNPVTNPAGAAPTVPTTTVPSSGGASGGSPSSSPSTPSGKKGKKGNSGGGEEEPKGVMVVSAFEDYAFRRGLRVGDRIVKVGGEDVRGWSADKVRDQLRGEPETFVTLTIERETKRPAADPNPEDLSFMREVKSLGLGINFAEKTLAKSPALPFVDPTSPLPLGSPSSGGENVRTFEVDLPRSVVRLRDVKLATLLDPTGKPIATADAASAAAAWSKVGPAASSSSKAGQALAEGAGPIGYIQLSGFTQDTGLEILRAIVGLERQAQKLEAIKDATASYEAPGAASGQASGQGGAQLDSGQVDSGKRQHALGGIILDLRDNPGGLLSSAVDVASLLVPRGSDLVSAQGRGFQGVLYRSNGNPVRDLSAPLVVLVNQNTASAAEIVSGAIQDLDVGVIVGEDKTFGKGLVQNIEGMKFDTALKFTVAKYYTPSGRCIQETEYKDGRAAKARRGGDKAAPFQPAAPPSAAPPSEVSPSEAGIEAGASEEGTSDGGQASNTAEEDQEDEEGDEEDEEEDEEEEVSFGRGSGDAGKKGYTARKVKSADRKVFKTKTGRVVRDGGGVEADVRVPRSSPVSLIEVLLLREGTLFDFASQWAQANAYSGARPVVTDAVFADFTRFVFRGLKSGEIRPEAVYAPQLAALEKGFKESGQVSPLSSATVIRGALEQEVKSDLAKHEVDLRFGLEEAILSRYLPESQLRGLALERDGQVG